MEYTISEDITLPSLGKVYDDLEVNPHVKMRSMTTREEMRRLSPSDKPYKNMCEIIDDCLVEKPGISCYDMCLADYQYLLYQLRIVTYGKDYKIESTCPYCGVSSVDTVNLEMLNTKTFSEDFEEYQVITLPKTKKVIKLRMQTPRLLDQIALAAKDAKQKKGTLSDSSSAFFYTLKYLIDTIDGDKLDALKLEDFVTALPMMDTNYLLKKAEKLNERLGIDNTAFITCPICGLDYSSPFRITSEFYGPSVDE